ncbi:MAG TPA: glycoside hydrolase family 25 protein [Pyrinomonadaceae bacterium]|jgi:lysozyme
MAVPTNYKEGDIRGVDVSHHQGVINWQKVSASGVVYAYTKATESIGFMDSRFATNFAGMKSNGILRGAYHFFRPKRDAKAQAENFIDVVKHVEPGDLPPALDVEVDDGKTPGVIIKGVRTWLETVEQAFGRTPAIYTSASFWNSKLGGTEEFGEHPLWVAHYTDKPKPAVPKGFATFDIWQFTDSGAGAVNGITSTKLDLNRFNGTMDQLRKLAGL